MPKRTINEMKLELGDAIVDLFKAISDVDRSESVQTTAVKVLGFCFSMVVIGLRRHNIEMNQEKMNSLRDAAFDYAIGELHRHESHRG